MPWLAWLCGFAPLRETKRSTRSAFRHRFALDATFDHFFQLEAGPDFFLSCGGIALMPLYSAWRDALF
jgi:hypothetical protein